MSDDSTILKNDNEPVFLLYIAIASELSISLMTVRKHAWVNDCITLRLCLAVESHL